MRMPLPATQSGATCPSCGRFVGPLETCPHCGASIKKRIPLRYLRLGALVLALLGVGVFVFAARGIATPVTKISAIGATMNYAYVRLEGTVTRGPLYDKGTQTVRFYIADDTGEIQAAAFRDVARDLIQSDRVPAAGDHIVAEGTLRIRDDFTSFTLSSSDKLKLARPAPQRLEIGAINDQAEFSVVRVQGDVREVRQPYQGLSLVTIGDGTGELDIAVGGDVVALYGAVPEVRLGETIQVQGVVTHFRDLPQLVLRHPRDFIRLPVVNTADVVIAIGTLDAARLNQRLQIAGRVTRTSKFSQGLRAAVMDETGEITLVLWQNVLDEMPAVNALERGAEIHVRGTLSRYQGAFELIPAGAEDIIVDSPAGLTPAPQVAPTSPGATPKPSRTATQAPVARTLGSLTALDKDRVVGVNGKIANVNSFAQGARFTLDDGTGSITVILWSDVLEKVEGHVGLQPGAQVKITGRVNVYRNELEIVPAHPEDVTVLVAVVAPTPALRTIHSLSTNDLGQTVLLRGTIRDLSDFSQGQYVTLVDDSGQTRVTVFSNILKQVTAKLVRGALVQVRGKVNLYRGELEVIADQIQAP